MNNIPTKTQITLPVYEYKFSLPINKSFFPPLPRCVSVVALNHIATHNILWDV